VWNGINCRALDGRMPSFFKGNPTFFVVMAAIIAIQVLIVQYGGDMFHTVPLSSDQWIKVIVLPAFVLVIGLVLRLSYSLYRANRDTSSQVIATNGNRI
jgi:Ca2+-transporting ATPase